MRLQPERESNSFRIWNPKTRRVVEIGNVIFIETPPYVLPPSRRLSPVQGLEAPTFDFSDSSLDDNYSSRNDMIQDSKDCTSALDFEANDALLIPTPGGSSPGGTTTQEPSSDTPVPASAPGITPAPGPTPAALQAIVTDTDGYAMQPGITRAVACSQVRSSATTNFWANRNNHAALTGFFQKDTVQQVHKLGSAKLGSHANLDIAHQLDDTFSTGNAYATTNTQGRFSSGEQKEKIPNSFKEAMGLPQAERWKAASDRKVSSLEKHGVYELIPITSVPKG